MRDKLKAWVVNDYFTPNIKAEVILDALLTPYIAEIIKKQCGVDAVFVTKEMSVLDESREDNRGEKIDYILANKDAVYLVELKTTDGSIDTNQAERYRENCQGKNFGEVFGDKLLKIMSEKTSVRVENADKPENQLQALFDTILLKYSSNAEGTPDVKRLKAAERAKALLKQKNWGSTYKYLYTMGQLLDYLDKSEGRTLWDLPLKLLYLTPTGISPHENLLKNCPEFYLHPEETNSVSLQVAAANLREAAEGLGDELAGLLADIIIEIYGE